MNEVSQPETTAISGRLQSVVRPDSVGFWWCLHQNRWRVGKAREYWDDDGSGGLWWDDGGALHLVSRINAEREPMLPGSKWYRAMTPDESSDASIQGSDGDLEGLAHEIWAAAQLLPREGIVDGVDHIKEIMLRCKPGIRLAENMEVVCCWPDGTLRKVVFCGLDESGEARILWNERHAPVPGQGCVVGMDDVVSVKWLYLPNVSGEARCEKL